MDHHCPWVANCIGFRNYKYFMNMLIYTSLATLIISSTSAPVLVAALKSDEINSMVAYYIITSYLLTSSLCFVITGFLCFHLWLVLKQYTTIEFCEKKANHDIVYKKSPYNLNYCDNFKTVMGDNILFWFLPICKNSDGLTLVF